MTEALSVKVVVGPSTVKLVGAAAIRHTAANSESFLDADSLKK